MTALMSRERAPRSWRRRPPATATSLRTEDEALAKNHAGTNRIANMRCTHAGGVPAGVAGHVGGVGHLPPGDSQPSLGRGRVLDHRCGRDRRPTGGGTRLHRLAGNSERYAGQERRHDSHDPQSRGGWPVRGVLDCPLASFGGYAGAGFVHMVWGWMVSVSRSSAHGWEASWSRRSGVGSRGRERERPVIAQGGPELRTRTGDPGPSRSLTLETPSGSGEPEDIQ